MKKNMALENLYRRVMETRQPFEKLELLDSCEEVKTFLSHAATVRQFLAGLTPECDIAIKSVLAIGQGKNLFGQLDTLPKPFESLREFLQPMLEVEKFYASMGGIVGYYFTAMKLMAEKKLSHSAMDDSERLYKPSGLDISKKTSEVQSAIRQGIDHLPQMAEIYPLGGAGDRLDLRDESSGEPLPAGYLPYAGLTLLEGLVRDLQAKEYLYWKLHRQQLLTPIAMMTSEEKNNERRILDVCKKLNWFGRPAAAFRWFKQPLVPVIVETGNFALSEPLKLILKPGGHGVIWKLAQDCGILDWFKELNRTKALVRQINNPVAGTDGGVLALSGIGCAGDMHFGVASCPRLVNTAEGMLVRVEKSLVDRVCYTLVNIEYTDFQAKGLKDQAEAGSSFSLYPANTNILFVDIEAVKKALKITPVPGVLINMKSQSTYIDEQGCQKLAYGGRLEAMMQNIADQMPDCFPQKLTEEKQAHLKSFLTYNLRRKTISVTKNQYDTNKSPLETPHSCLFDHFENCRELLTDYCGISLPSGNTLEEYLQHGPSFIMHYHPALGPLYPIIGSKIHGGRLHQGSELLLEIAELEMRGLNLRGSLRIEARSIYGHYDENGIINYSDLNGKCELIDVNVENRGIDRSVENRYWCNQIARHEQLEIILHGNGEFFAEGVTFTGAQRLEVPDGHRMEVRVHAGDIKTVLQPITKPTWAWAYAYDDNGAVTIRKRR